MPSIARSSAAAPVADQAAGLRQMFATRTIRFVPVVSNPHLMYGGVVLERLCAAFGQHGLHTLVVDAGERSPAPRELAQFDLREGIERLSSEVSFLAARSLPLRHVDSRGSSAGFIDALVEAAPQVDVVLMHATAPDLCRMFAPVARAEGANRLRPIVGVDCQAASMTHAYAAIKLLAQRGGFYAHDLIVSNRPRSTQVAKVARRLADCADNFVQAVQRTWVELDPRQPPDAPPDAPLLQLATDALAVALAQPAAVLPPHPEAALPARFAPTMN